MKNIVQSTVLLLMVFVIGTSGVRAQHVPSRERVDPTLRRKTEIDGNNVRTSVFNFVFSGRTGVGQGVPYEWPKNTNRYYVALVGLFIGAEVIDNTGQTIRMVDLPAYRSNPSTGEDWNLNPVPGYFNTARPGVPVGGIIAKSDDSTSWPAIWPDKLADPRDPGWAGKWNGYFGKNQFNADQEMYYRVGDDNYNRFNYTPDTTDLTRKGLGAIVDVRVLEWSQISVADAVFFIQEIKNDGTKDLPKTGVTLWLADFVGGDGDSQDDHPEFDLIDDIAYSMDADGHSSNPAFANSCVGCAATIYLETPGNAEDRIDNDGDSPEFELGPRVTQQMLGPAGSFPAERSGNQIDENHNGLIDEDSTYIPFGVQRGVGFADGIDNNGNGEPGCSVVTAQMVAQALTDPWQRWPPNPESDPFWAPNNPFKQASIHLIQVGPEDVGKVFKDNIDNDNDSLSFGLPTVTQAMIDTATSELYHRYKVPGTNVVLYGLDSSDLGKRYLNADGLANAGVDEGIDEMIDESRNDGVDNDGDWNPLTDDVGLDGAPNTLDFGEGDGKPTSGVGTSFPGEPNIDKTDVSEADQIGLTNVQYIAAGGITFSTTPDNYFWQVFMLPGSFVDPGAIPVGESDLFVSSGVFPLKAGQIERISYAVVFGLPGVPPNCAPALAKDDARRKRVRAVQAYNEDYQFAQAPIEPTVTAVSGSRVINGVTYSNKPQVTLYWNDKSERSEDRFLAGVGGPRFDFEGYRIYRATDPAFEDARTISDGYGNPAPFLKPIAQFDLDDDIQGFDSTDFNGVKFFSGSNTGLVHAWTDTTVVYGQKYYYAVRGYDRGYPPLAISPAESNLKISINDLTGEVQSIGSSVAIITPEAPSAGYVAPKVSPITLVTGTTTGTVGYEIIDANKIRDNVKYRVTFEDTVLHGSANAPDTFKTKSFTLTDVTNGIADTLIGEKREMADSIEQPVIDGFRLIIRNEKLFGLNPALSGWSRPGIYQYDFKQWKNGFYAGLQKPNDYKIVFGQVGIDTSTQSTVAPEPGGTPPAIPVNFKVINTSENKQIDFAFFELDNTGGPGVFSAGLNIFGFTKSDYIVFLERDLNDSLIITWSFALGYDSTLAGPQAGDTMVVVLSKLFRQGDVFEFTTTAQNVDRDLAKNGLDKIRVVPNPYVAAASWEERNPFSNGRGPRAIHFTHLPQVCTIRIFTVSGELVKTIDHNSAMLDGEEDWNLLTRDNLSVSYGIYIYHLDAPGVGEKIGKFAIIK